MADYETVSLLRSVASRSPQLLAAIGLWCAMTFTLCAMDTPISETTSLPTVVPAAPDLPPDGSGADDGETTFDAALANVPPLEDYESLAWRKGDYTIVPYGIGWLNMAFDTERTNNGAFTFFVFSRDVEGQPGFTINARATRLGLDFTGPPVSGASYGGKVEIDFFGSAQTENRAGVLLRHAYGEFRTDDWRLLGGQTYDVVAPLNPGMLNYTLGYAAGNIGYRRAQVRAERYLRPSDNALVTLQAALARSIVTDFVTDTTTLEGHDAGWPTIQARAALAFGGDGADLRPIELGVSSHIGQEAVDFQAPPIDLDVPFTSWSLNVDLHCPLGQFWGVQGELFWGDVLGTFLGGINQGIDPDSRLGIRSLGGWGEVWLQPSDTWRFHAGYGIDDPLNSRLSIGRRTRNQVFFANAIYSVTDLFDVGVEMSWWETQYQGLAPGESLRLETVVRYRF